jgi:hypothetical protein
VPEYDVVIQTQVRYRVEAEDEAQAWGMNHTWRMASAREIELVRGPDVVSLTEVDDGHFPT